jgi:N-acetyltransferase
MDVIPLDSSGSGETEESPKRTVEVAGVFCNPQQLPTPMGISRMFVSSKHRRQGIARALLNAAAETFIPGCHLDPRQSQIAFSQPTGDGNKVMQDWGEGRIRIYEED